MNSIRTYSIYLSILLCALLTYHEPCSKTKYKISAYSLIFIHHLCQILFFIIPWVLIKELSVSMYAFLILGIMYVLFQNIWNSDKVQSCVLSRITNDMCGQSKESPLRDMLYYLNLKTDIHFYTKMYNIFCIFHLIGLVYVFTCKYHNIT